MKKKLIHLAASLLVVCFFNGCFVISEFVVGGETAVFADNLLPGLWQFPGRSGYMLIAQHKNSEYSFHYFTGNFVADAEYFSGKLTKVGGKTFFNVRRFAALGEKASDSGYIPVHYELEADKLKIAIFETKFFNEAIAAKKLTGQAPVQSSTYSTAPTRISSKGEDLARFILDNWTKPGLFEKAQVMERIKVALPPPVDDPAIKK